MMSSLEKDDMLEKDDKRNKEIVDKYNLLPEEIQKKWVTAVDEAREEETRRLRARHQAYLIEREKKWDRSMIACAFTQLECNQERLEIMGPKIKEIIDSDQWKKMDNGTKEYFENFFNNAHTEILKKEQDRKEKQEQAKEEQSKAKSLSNIALLNIVIQLENLLDSSYSNIVRTELDAITSLKQWKEMEAKASDKPS